MNSNTLEHVNINELLNSNSVQQVYECLKQRSVDDLNINWTCSLVIDMDNIQKVIELRDLMGELIGDVFTTVNNEDFMLDYLIIKHKLIKDIPSYIHRFRYISNGAFIALPKKEDRDKYLEVIDQMNPLVLLRCYIAYGWNDRPNEIEYADDGEIIYGFNIDIDNHDQLMRWLEFDVIAPVNIRTSIGDISSEQLDLLIDNNRYAPVTISVTNISLEPTDLILREILELPFNIDTDDGLVNFVDHTGLTIVKQTSPVVLDLQRHSQAITNALIRYGGGNNNELLNFVRTLIGDN